MAGVDGEFGGVKTSYLLEGGRLSIGFIVGSLTTLFILLFLDFFALLPFSNSAFTGTIIGALVAGSIGLSGQIIVLLQSSYQLKEKTNLEERATLESLFSKIVQNLAIFRDVKRHLISDALPDNIYFGKLPTLSKPIKIGGAPEQFTTLELALAIRLADKGLFNLLNVSNSNAKLFSQTHLIYDQKVQLFMGKIQKTQSIKFEEGSLSGVVEINPADHYELTDIQKHYWDATYSGLLLSCAVLAHIDHQLRHRHGTSMDFNSGVSEEEIQWLIEAVELGDFREDVIAILDIENQKQP